MSALVSRALRGMNTDFHLIVRIEPGIEPGIEQDTPEQRAAAEAALDACGAWLAAMERTCSRFLPDSELCALNAAAGTPFHASEDLFAVVSLALDAAARTAGLFDPTILPALHAAGYTRSFDEIGHRELEEIPATPAPVSRTLPPWRSGRWREIALDAERRVIALPEHVALDLGGIAKGWAADELARRFLSAFPAYLIDLGGDLRAQGGPEPGKPWIVAVADPREATTAATGAAPPRDTAYLAGIPLAAGGIATSGDARRWWLRGGARQHHLIDPRTGRPALPHDGTRLEGRVLAWTALAATTAAADVLAKVAYLRGYPEGLRALTRRGESAGLCVFANGQIETTANLEEYLHAHAIAGS